MSATYVATNVPKKTSEKRRHVHDDPFSRSVAERRAELGACITLSMVKQVIDTLFNLALNGNISAARLFLQYAVGKPEVIPAADAAETPASATDALMSAALAALQPEVLDTLVATPSSEASVALSPGDAEGTVASHVPPDQTACARSAAAVHVPRDAGSNGSTPRPGAEASGSFPACRGPAEPNAPSPLPGTRAGGRGA
jgi:hypothetical protein